MRKFLSRPAPILSAIAVLALCLAVLLIRPRDRGLIGEITDISRYEEVLSSLQESPLVSHFPEAIPPEASEAQMFYAPALFQGGTIFQLRLELPPPSIVDLQAHYGGTASQVLPTRATASPADSLTAVPLPSFVTGDAPEGLFPETYTLFLLLSQPQGDLDFPWNHGYTSGVAIDPRNSQIVYWAEDW